MTSLLVALAIAASPPADASQKTLSLAAPGLKYVGIDPSAGDVYLDYFTQQLSLKGHIRVTTRDEVAVLLGVERQKQLLGCGENTGSCIAELAGALGSDGVITGSLAKLGTGFVANIKIVANNGEPLAVFSQRVPTEDALLSFLEKAAAQFAANHGAAQPKQEIVEAVEPSAPSVEAMPSTGRSKLWMAPAAVGVVALGASGVFALQAKATKDRLDSGDESIHDVTALDKAVADGKGQQQVALILGAVGVAAGVATAVMLATGSEGATASVSIAPTGSGAAFVVDGRFP